MDRGVATERTALAWERTGFGLVGVGGLLTHAGRPHAALLLALGVVVLTLGALVAVAYPPLRSRQVERAVTARLSPLARPSVMRALTATILATALITAASLLA